MNASSKTTASRADPYRLFIGRTEVIQAFDDLVSPEASRRILLVDGLSGTGKSFLADWLHRTRRANVPAAKITLSPVFQERDVLSSIIAQLDPQAAGGYAAAIAELDASDQEHPLVQLSLSQSAEGRLGGSVSNVQQSFQVSLGEAAGAAELQRRARRLDSFSKALGSITSKPYVIFFDECEHLANPDLRAFILQVLVPRLQSSGSNLRLYFSGQAVPTEAFSSHEYRIFHLAGFDFAETGQMLSKAGFTDAQLQRRVFDFTAGHPLLLAMWLEDVLDARQPSGQLAFPEEAVDEASRTRWIYDRIVGRFTDSDLRAFAANLCLLAWFDLSLIRSVFGATISEQSFDQMVRRSFIKPLGRRWRCHDIILKYLPAHRRETDPDACDVIHERAEQALTKRLATEEERSGAHFFVDRLLLASAIVHSTSQISRSRAERFAVAEVVAATVAQDRDYLLGLARDLETHAGFPALVALGDDTTRLLAQMGARRVDSRSLKFLEQLAAAAEGQQDPGAAQELYYAASVIAGGHGSHAKALSLAEAASRVNPSPENRVLCALSAARGGDSVKARAQLEACRDEFGDSADVRLAEADVASEGGDAPQAVRILTECIAAFPDSAVEAFLRLARMAIQKGDNAGAAKHLDAVLEREPANFDALNLRSGILIDEGRIHEALPLIGRMSGKLLNVIDAGVRLYQQLLNAGVRERLLADFAQDPRSVNPGILLALLDVLAMEGKVDDVDAISSRLSEIWPETADLGMVKRGVARLAARRLDAVPPLLEPLVARGLVFLDLYLALAGCYGQQGQYERQRAVLQQAIDRLPGAADLFAADYARSLARDHSAAEALHYLDDRDPIGPHCLLAKAELLAASDRSAAEDVLQHLIYTEDRDSLPEPGLVSARIMYGSLLLLRDEKDAALEILDTTLDLFPDNRQGILLIADLFGRLGDEERLRRLAGTVRERMPAVSFQIMNALAFMIAARDPEPAALLDEFKQHPDRLELLLAIERILGVRGRVQDAPEWFSQAEHAVPGILAEIQNLRKKMLSEASETTIEELLQKDFSDPANIQIALGASEMLASRGRITEALNVLDRAAKACPDALPLAMNLKVRILLQIGRTDEASALLAPALSGEAPLYPELIDGGDRLLAQRGDVQGRIDLWRRVAKLFPQHRASAIESLATILFEETRFAEALAAIEEVTSQGEGGPPLLTKAKILRKLERRDEAFALASAVESAPGATPIVRAVAADIRGDIWRDRGDSQQALEAYRAACSNHPDFASGYVGIALALEKLERPGEAYDALMQAIACAPSLAGEFADRLQRLKSAERQKTAAPGHIQQPAGQPPHSDASP